MYYLSILPSLIYYDSSGMNLYVEKLCFSDISVFHKMGTYAI